MSSMVGGLQVICAESRSLSLSAQSLSTQRYSAWSHVVGAAGPRRLCSGLSEHTPKSTRVFLIQTLQQQYCCLNIWSSHTLYCVAICLQLSLDHGTALQPASAKGMTEPCCCPSCLWGLGLDHLHKCISIGMALIILLFRTGESKPELHNIEF